MRDLRWGLGAADGDVYKVALISSGVWGSATCYFFVLIQIGRHIIATVST